MAVVVLEVLEGVGPFLLDEVARRLPAATVTRSTPTEVEVEVHGAGADGLGGVVLLRTAVAAHLVLRFAVPRPRTLRSPEHLVRITDAVAALRRAARPERFTGVRISAAGRDSDDVVALAAAIAEAAGLEHDPDDGDLLVRLRRPAGGGPGWEVLLRLTPRPLSARAWRVVDRPGALNATIAAALVRTLDPAPDDTVADLTCGSGTILLERLAAGPAARLVGVDLDPDALAAAAANQRASRLRGRIEWVAADSTAPGAVAGRFRHLVANLPWGSLVGSHEENDVLYPAVLAAATDLVAPGGTFSVLTHDLRRLDRALLAHGGWAEEAAWRFFQKGHRPRLQRLRPRPGR